MNSVDHSAASGRVDTAANPPLEAWARRFVPLALLAAAAVGVWHGLMGPDPPSARRVGRSPSGVLVGGPRVFTPFDFARMGNDAALDYLRSLDSGRHLRAVLAAQAAVVRFRASARKDGKEDGFWAEIGADGSGVLVNGGRHLLVAGHGLEVVENHPDQKFSISMPDGSLRHGKVTVVRGSVDGAPKGDWGLVELEGEPPADCPSLTMRDAVPGSTVVLLGYSGSMGTDAEGGVYPAGNMIRVPLRPLMFVGRVDDTDRGSVDTLAGMKVEIVAGMKTERGMSGGAVLDLDGKLVGVIVQTTYSWEAGDYLGSEGGFRSPTNPGRLPDLGREFRMRLSIGSTPVAVFREYVEKCFKE